MKNKLSIGIIGTRGIPNEYGGYEAVVQELGPRLASRGHNVVVYCSSAQVSRLNSWKNVKLIYNYDPESWMGSSGQFVYDLLSNFSSRRLKHDVIFHMGYTSDSVWQWIWDRKAVHLTNMDGLEWKRTKYSKRARKFLGFAEKLATNNSDALIADNNGIENYLLQKYNTPVINISYGVDIPDNFTNIGLESYNLTNNGYDLVIARMVPENNIETIIKAKISSFQDTPLVIFGNSTKYREYLIEQYSENSKIFFHNGDFDKTTIDSLRHFARYYIHGHSVGGTNPSLLEAMAAGSKIIAHDNEFNRSVLGTGGQYFINDEQLSTYFNSPDLVIQPEQVDMNFNTIETNHNWEHICDQYERAAYKYQV